MFISKCQMPVCTNMWVMTVQGRRINRSGIHVVAKPKTADDSTGDESPKPRVASNCKVVTIKKTPQLMSTSRISIPPCCHWFFTSCHILQSIFNRTNHGPSAIVSARCIQKACHRDEQNGLHYRQSHFEKPSLIQSTHNRSRSTSL